jgi:NADH-quinone oxidoreductase subunit C
MADDATATAEDVGAEAPEVDEKNEALLARFAEALGAGLVDSHIANGTLWARVAREAWVEAAGVAKDRLGCTFFDFLSGIDWLPSPWGRYEDAAVDTGFAGIPDATGVDIETGVTGGDTRFQVFCRLANVRLHHALIIKVDVPDEDFTVPTISHVYPGANWHERECWEMYGIEFPGHPALRHLYLPGGFEGHPLRKDFPLLARLVKPWPGIVDVEPMPEAPSEAEGEGADGEAPAEQADGEGGDT